MMTFGGQLGNSMLVFKSRNPGIGGRRSTPGFRDWNAAKIPGFGIPELQSPRTSEGARPGQWRVTTNYVWSFGGWRE